MAHFTFNLLHYFQPKRDSYGFALRPQYAQRYKEYSYIYREEEDERSDKWRDFLEQLGESSQPTFENEHEVTLNAEPGSNKVKEERNPHRLSNGDDSSRRNFSELEETNVVRVSEVLEKGDSSYRTTSGGTEIKEGTSPERVSEGDDSSGRNFTSDSTTGNNSGKELHHSEDRKTRKVQHWAEIRPSLTAIEETLSSRVKKRKTMKGAQINGNNDHLPSIEENAFVDQDLPEHFSQWKELESLVQGGVPKDLRGEVWQAFVGVKTRRVESYYEDLLARDESEEQDVPSAAFGKWKKQIEKVISCMRLGLYFDLTYHELSQVTLLWMKMAEIP